MREQERVVIIGKGGREHAIGWKLKQSSGQPQLFFAPGNAGTQQIGTNLDIGVMEIERLVRFASDKKIGLTIVGPENPLEKGIVNVFMENELPIFGPTQEAARLETSKSWAIKFMERHNIPCPKSIIIADRQMALHYVENAAWKEIVIKADGLAAGKGVFLPESKQESLDAVSRIFNKEFDEGSKVIFQERLVGKESSLLAFTDGETIVPLLPAKDYKRLKDGDMGPNTGSMGAFAPAPMDERSMRYIYDKILRPAVDGMKKEGFPFKGILYAAIIMTSKGPKVLEFNARFGDPETQPLMMLFESDLLRAMKNIVKGNLKRNDAVFRQGAAVCVVLAAEGYPGEPTKGDIIYGLDKINDPDIQIFHAGTKVVDGKIKTNGGRILALTSYGKDRKSAREKLVHCVGENGVNFRGMQNRKDIAA